jgi:hypothetical protein
MEENLGVQMLRRAAEKTGNSVGDGASTPTILAHAVFADGFAMWWPGQRHRLEAWLGMLWRCGITSLCVS